MIVTAGAALSTVEKRFSMGFVVYGNERPVDAFLRSLLARGLDSSQGLLVIIDGGKGLKAALLEGASAGPEYKKWHKRLFRPELSVRRASIVVAWLEAVAVGLQQAGIWGD